MEANPAASGSNRFEDPGTSSAAHRAVADLGRASHARIVAVLAWQFGDLDLVEDVLQEAFVAALQTWPQTGIPRVPEAWVTTTARNRAIDHLRHERGFVARAAQIHGENERRPVPDGLRDPADQVAENDDEGIPDERLGLIFACAHPALALADRIALTLRFVAGLSVTEVAHALLVPKATMQQRIVRAKKRIRTKGIPFALPRPEDRGERRAAVQRVILLLYSEGFSRSDGATHVRDDLTAEAIRLARVLDELMPETAEVTGLLALLLLSESRRPARTDAAGRPVPLRDQDRQRWTRSLIVEGTRLAERAAGMPGAGTYATQAAIAAVHAEAPSFEQTDWAQIVVLYRLLERHETGPLVRVGKAVALGRALGPVAGLLHLDALRDEPVVMRERSYHVARAMTLVELGEREAAAAAYREALETPGNAAETDFLALTLADLESSGIVPSVDAGSDR